MNEENTGLSQEGKRSDLFIVATLTVYDSEFGFIHGFHMQSFRGIGDKAAALFQRNDLLASAGLH